MLALLTSASCADERVCVDFERPRCGDGVVDPDEACDPGDPASGPCNASCRVPGELIWAQRYDGGRSGSARSVAVDPCTGEVAVVGLRDAAMPDANGNPGSDAWVGSVDVEGQPRWSKRHAYARDASASAVAIGPTGEVVAAGLREIDDERSEVWLRRYTNAGELEWTRAHEVSHTIYETFVAIDASATIYWAESGGLYADARLHAIDPKGATRWAHDFDENLYAILPGDPGDDELSILHGVYLNGPDEQGFNRASRFSRSGELLESHELAEARLDDVTRTSAGGWAWIAWGDQVEAFDRQGELVWEIDFNSTDTNRYPQAITADVDGIVVVGDIDPFSRRRPWIAELSHTGELVGEHMLDLEVETSVAAVELGPAGDIVMVGSTAAPPDLVAGEFWSNDAWMVQVARLR